MKKAKKVIVGLSGGVDSALSAALLKEQGFDVTGVYLKAWDEAVGADGKSYCPWREDIADARRVSAQLGIPFSVIDVREAYKKRVVEELKSGYAKGQTPNPDILCNSQMKFGLLLDVAGEAGYDFVATGHYGRIKNGKLARGVDSKKDQTYFLWAIEKSKLNKIIFPIGGLTKSQVRKEAKKRGLPVSQKPDSQGICFLGPVSLRDFLKNQIKTQPGDVFDIHGNKIGTHEGANLYTIGQRHGFKIESRIKNHELRVYYVIHKDVKSNRIVVDTKASAGSDLIAINLNWLVDAPKSGDKIQARIRHGQAPQDCRAIKVQKDKVEIAFSEPQTAIAAGQSVVFSKGDIILGGGIIQ